jgi:Cu(I)/Ag(I) efflux system membrane fusion protein
MRRKLSILAACLVVVAASAATLYVWRPDLFERRLSSSNPMTPESKYYCPMHPQQRSDKEGNCPICSMKLVKMEKAPSAAETAAMHAEHSGTPAQVPATSPTEAPAVFVAPERQQLIGIKTTVAERRPLVREIRAVGKIAFDETRVTHIHTKVSGFIEEVFVDYVGRPVKRGEPLFTIYSPDLVATQEEYLLALKSNQTLRDSSFKWVSKGSVNLLEAARKRLELWDITEAEITDLEKASKAKRALTIYSPVSGIVTERAAYHHGRTVTPEMDLYTIVDLSSVWILGQVYEYELPFIRLGQQVQVEFPYGAGTRERTGTVVFISPTLDPKTRTAELRVEFPNLDMTLKPDMYVNFKARVGFGSPLVVPTDAVLDTGSEQYVFVDKGQGYFEPRTVKLGPEAGGMYAIESGLKAGERVVTAANFILDSESRLKGVIGNMGTPSAPSAAAAAPAPHLQVEIVEPRTAKVGRNSVRLIAKDAQGNLIPDAEVDISVFMPQMGAMAPMRSSAQLKPTGQGQYAGEIDIPMAWTWETTVTAKKGGVTIGTAKTNITAR